MFKWTPMHVQPVVSQVDRPGMSDTAHAGRIPLTLGALGVVFGDIGTSPLYTLKECALAAGDSRVSTEDILGILSLMAWSLFLVITVKYVWFILRADHE